MSTNRAEIPVALFAYNRPQHVRRTLSCLQKNHVPLIYAFSDGPRSDADRPLVEAVRSVLRAVDWCEVKSVERSENLGLGRSILTGVTEIFQRHEAAVVFEDDLVCVPGTYDYLCRALRHYRNDPRVMSVTGWTHPRVTPAGVQDRPYFDGRAESLAWGAWARSWTGMTQDAWSLLQQCHRGGIDVFRYGADLPATRQTGTAEERLGRPIPLLAHPAARPVPAAAQKHGRAHRLRGRCHQHQKRGVVHQSALAAGPRSTGLLAARGGRPRMPTLVAAYLRAPVAGRPGRQTRLSGDGSGCLGSCRGRCESLETRRRFRLPHDAAQPRVRDRPRAPDRPLLHRKIPARQPGSHPRPGARNRRQRVHAKIRSRRGAGRRAQRGGRPPGHHRGRPGHG